MGREIRSGRSKVSSLAEYRAKRDFARTPEPAGAGSSAEARAARPRFVVQRHRARRLHYDLRLEIEGVLASWAVPRGPTLDPSARLLAVHVEDHPIEYLDFEGAIPAGEYGGGDVIVWDRGTWVPADGMDPRKAIADGELHFDLYGEKLTGRFVLIRRGASRGEREQWLLLHKRDEYAQAGWRPDDHPRSVKSGRTNDEVAAAPAALWRSGVDPSQAEVAVASEPTAEELRALDDLGQRGEWTVGGRTLELTNLDKVLLPARGHQPAATKRDLIRYYVSVASALLPYLADRPLNLRRFPNGIAKRGFWQRETPAHAPAWLRRWHNVRADEGEAEWYMLVDDAAGLAWLANEAAVEINPWTSRVPNVDEPTHALVDIDPGEKTTFDDLVVLARLFRTALDHVGVAGFPKLSGQTGIQISVPIAGGYTFDETRAWVKQLSRAVSDTVPDLVSWRWRTRERGGLARLDYTQNAINKTVVAPYSVRPSAGSPVAVPIDWDELDELDLRPDLWTIRTVGERLARRGDPGRAMVHLDQKLPSL